MKQIYFIIGLFCFSHSLGAQHCAMTESIAIPDNNTPYSIRKEVNSRSSGEKILCGVRLSFEHEYAEELRFELISPTGRSVTLIGGHTSSANTDNSSWDILFQRNENQVKPDPFQKEHWAENSWDRDRAYTGSYYPEDELGLEYFDGESSLGTWSLLYQDLVKGSSGRLLHFELIFCDSRITCQPCALSADLIEPAPPLSYCGGDPGLEEIRPFVLQNQITEGFDYIFMAFDSSAIIVDQGKSIDLSKAPAGQYSVSAVQIRPENMDLITEITSKKELNGLINGLQPKICGVISKSALEINILSEIMPHIREIEVYGRDDYVVDEEIITRDTMIISQKTDDNHCSTISHIYVYFKTYTTDFSQPQRYDCENTSVPLIVRNSKDFPVRRWFTKDGRISNESGSRSNEITAEAPGTYHVVFEIEDYLDTVSYTLEVDPLTPVFHLENEYTLCYNDTLRAEIGRNFDQAWVDESTSASVDGRTLSVSEPGLYTIRIRKEDCTITKNVMVLPPDKSSEIQLPDEKITCTKQEVTVEPDLEETFDHYLWYRESEVFSKEKILLTSQPGYYTFRAYNDSECGVTASVWIEDHTSPFDMEIRGPDFIHCLNKDAVNRLEIAAPENHIPRWTDPVGTVTEGSSAPITTAGRYKVEITDEEGCIHISEREVKFDTTQVTITHIQDEYIIPCTKTSDTIKMAIHPELRDYKIEWEGAEKIGTPIFASVNQPGEVRVTVTNLDSQCRATQSTTVINDPQKPFLKYNKEADRTISCNRPEQEIEYQIENCAGCIIEYHSDQDIILDQDQKKIIAREPGKILITLTNQAGCLTSETIDFPSALKAAPLDIEIRNIGCEGRDGEIIIKNESQYEFIRFQNETDTFPYNPNKKFQNSDRFIILYKDQSSGCADSFEAEILKTDSGPDIEFDPVLFLDCDSRQALLSVKGKEITEITWMDADRNVIGDENQVTVTDPGIYTLYAGNKDWCTSTENIQVIDDTAIPYIDVKESYEIPCSSSTEGITISYDTTRLKSVRWKGPRGFSSSEFYPRLVFPGEYRIEITGKNGCTASQMTELREEAFGDLPAISGDPVTCTSPFSRLSLSDYSDLEEILWIDESGHSSREEIFEVFNPGEIKASLKNTAGCRATVRFVLTQDLDQVPFSINRPIINCDTPSPEIAVELGDEASRNRNIKYTWFRDSTLVGTESKIRVSEPAEYKVKVEYDNGCADSLSHRVAVDTVKPEVFLPNDTINCKRSKIQLSELVQTDLVHQAAWRGPQNFQSNEIRPGFTIPGPYTVLFTAKNGCSQITEFSIFEDKETPKVDSLDFLSFGCNGKKVPLEYFTRDSVIEQYWFLPNEEVLEQPAIEIGEKGEYILFLKGTNYCASKDTFLIEEQILPGFSLEIKNADCIENTGSALILPERDTFTVTWFTDSGDMLSTDSIAPPLLPGIYMVTVTNPLNHCDSVQLFEITDLSEVMAVEIAIDDSLRCERTSANLIPEVFPPSPNYLYEWKIDNQDLVFSTDSIAANIEDLGWYSLTVTDTVSHCVREASFLNEKAQSTLKGFDLIIKDPACHIDQPGSAIVHRVHGALNDEQMTFSLDGNRYYQMDTFPALYANTTYTISAKDQYGCRIDTMLFLQLRGIMDRTGHIKDTLINKGDTIQLNDPRFKINYTSADDPMAEKYEWIFNPDVFSCDFPCEEEVSAVLYESRFATVILTNEYGCTMEDSFHIYVTESEVINIPTGIIPSSRQEENAHACIYTNQYISKINRYVIFDSRGSVIFRKLDFDPRENNDYANCWNGRDDRGNILPQGNYNYYVSYETVYGKTKEKYGNIFLLR